MNFDETVLSDPSSVSVSQFELSKSNWSSNSLLQESPNKKNRFGFRIDSIQLTLSSQFNVQMMFNVL